MTDKDPMTQSDEWVGLGLPAQIEDLKHKEKNRERHTQNKQNYIVKTFVHCIPL